MEKVVRRTWMAPEIQRYGTFEQKTQACDKLAFGGTDGLTFAGSSLICAS